MRARARARHNAPLGRASAPYTLRRAPGAVGTWQSFCTMPGSVAMRLGSAESGAPDAASSSKHTMCVTTFGSLSFLVDALAATSRAGDARASTIALRIHGESGMIAGCSSAGASPPRPWMRKSEQPAFWLPISFITTAYPTSHAGGTSSTEIQRCLRSSISMRTVPPVPCSFTSASHSAPLPSGQSSTRGRVG